MGAANAVQTGMVQVTCTNGTFNVGWDNSNSYFADKGNIAAFYCQVVHNTGYISDNLTDASLRYYQGIVPSVLVPTPVETATPSQDTVTPSDETHTVVVVEPVSPSSPVETSTSGGQNQSSDTSSVVVETATQTSQPVETSTPPSAPDSQPVLVDTPSATNDSLTSIVLPAETQTSTSESSTQTIPQETATSPIETPLPTPIPAVEPQPVPHPVVVEPQPLPQPLPEPSAPVVESPVETVQPSDPVVPVEDPVTEEVPPAEDSSPVVEEQKPDEVQPEPPLEEDKPSLPADEELEQNQSEQNVPTPEPLPQPVVEPGPTSQPDTAYVPPTVTLDNGVILTQEVAEQVALLQDPGELLTELFTNPAAVIAALGSVGADMSPEARQKSKDAVVQAVIVGGIVSQAAGAAAYRRKP